MKTDCLARICAFARDYKSGDRSPRDIYNASDYSTYHADITQENIVESVSRDSSLIGDWVIYTENKRCSPSWGLSKRSETHWVVFHMSQNGHFDYELCFSSAVTACALMIRVEMESLRIGK